MRTGFRVLAVLAACHALACAGEAEFSAGVRLAPCRIDGLAEEIACARVSVLEDRSGRSDRRISIRVAVVPALARVAEPDPVVLLAGGPGQAATSFGPWIDTIFSRVRRRRDILLIDQRGTGASASLGCESDRTHAAFDMAGQEEASRACLASLDRDPRHYTNAPAMEDLDEIRVTLGYSRLNLWAGSYGTRAALVYMHAHPDRVRAAVLDGVAPWSLRFPLHTARDGERALRRLLDDCDVSGDCHGAFPALRDHLAELLRGLEAHPAIVTIRDPLTMQVREIGITREEFAVALRGFLYVGLHASAVPLMIERAYAGDFQPFLALRQAVAIWSAETMTLGLTRSVLCSEDLPRIRDDEIDAATRHTIVGPAEIALWRTACAPWPRAILPPEHDTALRFDGPVLILSGDLDPVVPPSWGEEVRVTMPRARHLVAPGVGHNVTPMGCAPDLIATFIERGEAASLDAGCLDGLARPPFVTSMAGWHP